jgi:hypothetical protein
MRAMPVICTVIAVFLGAKIWGDVLAATPVSGFGPFAEMILLVCFGTVPLWIRLASGSEAPRRPSGPFKVPSPNR